MRALLLILDSVGCGRAPDAAAYGDAGADTLGHIFAATPDLRLPTLDALGLAQIMGRPADTAPPPSTLIGDTTERIPPGGHPNLFRETRELIFWLDRRKKLSLTAGPTEP